MVSTKTKKKGKEIKPKTPYKNFTFFALFLGIMFLIVGMWFLGSGDSAGALLNGIAGLCFLMASYVFYKKAKNKR